MSEPREIFVDGAAGRLRLTDYGGAGPVVLALHGVTGGGFLWAGVARELAGRARIIAPDFRGHGRSDWAQGRGYETADHVADLSLIFDQVDFGPRPILIAASSWGALAAVSLLSQMPDLASHLMIVDVEPSFTARETDVFPRPYKFAGLSDVVEWERRANPHADARDVAAFAAASVTTDAEGAFLRRHDPYFLTHWPFRKDDRWQELAGLAQDIRVIHGENSFVREEICRRMAALRRGWSFAQIPRSGHLVPLEQPALLAREMADFFGLAAPEPATTASAKTEPATT